MPRNAWYFEHLCLQTYANTNIHVCNQVFFPCTGCHTFISHFFWKTMGHRGTVLWVFFLCIPREESGCVKFGWSRWDTLYKQTKNNKNLVKLKFILNLLFQII